MNTKQLQIAVVFLLAQGIQAQVQQDTLSQSIKEVKLRKGISHKGNKTEIEVSHTDTSKHDTGKFLNALPEISGIRKAGNYATDPVLRGFKYEQLNTVLDGSACTVNSCPSRMDTPVSQVNMNTIQQVEIYKGPYNFRYGTALGGSINFISGTPEFSSKANVGGSFSTGYESNGNIIRNELLAKLSTQKAVWNITGTYQKGDDYTDGNGDKVRSAFLRYSASTKGAFQWNEKNISTLQVQTNQSRDVAFAALNMDLIYDKTWIFQAGHQAKFENLWLKQLNASAYYSLVEHSMGTPNKMMVSDVKSHTYGGRAEFKIEKNQNTLYTGVDFKQDHAENVRLIMPKMMPPRDGSAWQNSTINQIGFFNEFQRALENATLSVSYRMDYNIAEAKDISKLFQELYGNTQSQQLNHSISAGYTHYLNDSATLAFWAGRGQRSASITERFINRFVVGIDAYEMLGNPHLKPETNNQADIIFTLKKEKIAFQFNTFASYMQDYVSGVVNPSIMKYSMQAPGVRQYVNINKAFKTGVEANIDWKLSTMVRSTLALAYTYAEDISTKNPLPEIAPLDVRFTTALNLSPFYIEGKVRYVAPQNRINPNFGELKTSDFYTIDLQARYTIFKNGYIVGSISNLLDRAYAEHLSRTLSVDKNKRILSQGRNFALSFVYSF